VSSALLSLPFLRFDSCNSRPLFSSYCAGTEFAVLSSPEYPPIVVWKPSFSCYFSNNNFKLHEPALALSPLFCFFLPTDLVTCLPNPSQLHVTFRSCVPWPSTCPSGVSVPSAASNMKRIDWSCIIFPPSNFLDLPRDCLLIFPPLQAACISHLTF